MISPSHKTYEKTVKKWGLASLVEYLKRWITWVHAGLPFEILNVDTIIKEIQDQIRFKNLLDSERNQSRVGDDRFFSNNLRL